MKTKNLLLLGALAFGAYYLLKPVEATTGGAAGSSTGYGATGATTAADAVTQSTPVAVTRVDRTGRVDKINIQNASQGVKLVNDVLQGRARIDTGARQIKKPMRNSDGSYTGVSRLGTGKVVSLTVKKVA